MSIIGKIWIQTEILTPEPPCIHMMLDCHFWCPMTLMDKISFYPKII